MQTPRTVILVAVDHEKRASDLIRTADGRSRQHVGVIGCNAWIAHISVEIGDQRLAHERDGLVHEFAKVEHAGMVDGGRATQGMESGR